jgi:uncharacterized membrane protein
VDMVGMVGVWVWGGVCLVGVVGLEGMECTMVLHIEMTKKYISILLKNIFVILKLVVLMNENNKKN